MDLPPNWKISRLGDKAIARTVSGGTPNRSISDYFGGDIPWVKSGELNDNYIRETEEKITQLGLKNSSAKIFPKETLLIALYGATAGKTAILKIEASANQAVCAIFPVNDSFDSGFLQYYLIYVRPQILNARSGGAQPNISQRVLSSLDVVLPPPPEQRAIAHVLRTVQQAREARLRELALEQERKAALMERLIVSKSWKAIPLEECAFVQTGVAKGRKFDDNSTKIRVPYLRVANVQDGFLDLEEIQTIEIRQSELDRFLLQTGDILLTEGGDFDKLGRGFIWHGQIPQCIHQNHVFAVRVNKELLTPEFLAYLIQSEYGKSYFLSVAHRTTHLACINSTKLKAFPTLIPDLAKQKEIVEVLSGCDSKIAALDHEARLLDELFRAMLEELMSGKLATGALADKNPV